MKKISLVAFFALTAVSTLFAQTVPSNVPTTGLVAYYGFNGNANDYSGNGNNGALGSDGYGATNPTLTTDRFGNANSAYQFGGVDNFNYIKVNRSSSLSFSNALSISFWMMQTSNRGADQNYCNVVAANDNTTFAIVTKGEDAGCSSSSGFSLRSIANGNTKTIHFSNRNSQSSSASGFSTDGIYNCYSAGEWIHVVIASGNGHVNTYINGVLVNSMPYNWSFGETNNSDMFIGALKDGADLTYPFNGKIDDIAVYNRALSWDEVRSLYDGYTDSYTSEPPIRIANVEVVNPCGTTNGTITITPVNVSGITYRYGTSLATSSLSSSNVITGGPGEYHCYVASDCRNWDTVITLECDCSDDVSLVAYDTICAGESGQRGGIDTIANYTFETGTEGWTYDGYWGRGRNESNTYYLFGTPQFSAHSGSYAFFCSNQQTYYTDYYFPTNTSYLISPAITLTEDPSSTPTTLTFYFATLGFSLYAEVYNDMAIQWSTSPSGPWSSDMWSITNFSGGYSSWPQATISLSSYLPSAGTYYFRIVNTGNGYASAIDDFIITADTRWQIPSDVVNGTPGTTVAHYDTLSFSGSCPMTKVTYWRINPTHNTEETVNTSGSYTWNGQSYTSSGNYTKTLTNQYGCDSTVTLHLFLDVEPSIVVRYDTICQGETGCHEYMDTLYYEDFEGDLSCLGVTKGSSNSTTFGVAERKCSPMEPTYCVNAYNGKSAFDFNPDVADIDDLYARQGATMSDVDYYTNTLITPEIPITDPSQTRISFRYYLEHVDGYCFDYYGNVTHNDWECAQSADGVTDEVAIFHLVPERNYANVIWYVNDGNYDYSNEDRWRQMDISGLGTTAGTTRFTFAHMNQGSVGMGVDEILVYGPRCIQIPISVSNAANGTNHVTYDTVYRNGCAPTIIETHWHVRDAAASDGQTTQITANESYTWHGTSYTTSGVYSYTYRDEHGCNVTEYLDLTINHDVPVIVRYDSICQGETGCHQYMDTLYYENFERGVSCWTFANGPNSAGFAPSGTICAADNPTYCRQAYGNSGSSLFEPSQGFVNIYGYLDDANFPPSAQQQWMDIMLNNLTSRATSPNIYIYDPSQTRLSFKFYDELVEFDDLYCGEDGYPLYDLDSYTGSTYYYYDVLNVCDEVGLMVGGQYIWGVGGDDLDQERSYPSGGPYDNWTSYSTSLSGLGVGNANLTFVHISQGGVGFGVDDILITGPRCISIPASVSSSDMGTNHISRDTVYRNGCTPTIIETHWHVRDAAAADGDTTVVNTDDDYTWFGRTYSESGVYSRTYQDSYGCNVTEYLNLTIDRSLPRIIRTDTICQGQTGCYTYMDTLFYDDFNSGNMSCWTNTTQQYTNGFTPQTQIQAFHDHSLTANSYQGFSAFEATNGPANLFAICDDPNHCDATILARQYTTLFSSPNIPIIDPSQTNITFYYFNQGISYAPAYFDNNGNYSITDPQEGYVFNDHLIDEVGMRYRIGGNSTWMWMENETNVPRWTQKSINLGLGLDGTQPAGGMAQIQFAHVNRGGIGMGIDNVLVYGPRCTQIPASVSAATDNDIDRVSYDTVYRNGCTPVVIETHWYIVVAHEPDTLVVETETNPYTWNGLAYTQSGLYRYDYTDDFGCAASDYLDLTIRLREIYRKDTICQGERDCHYFMDTLFFEDFESGDYSCWNDNPAQYSAGFNIYDRLCSALDTSYCIPAYGGSGHSMYEPSLGFVNLFGYVDDTDLPEDLRTSWINIMLNSFTSEASLPNLYIADPSQTTISFNYYDEMMTYMGDFNYDGVNYLIFDEDGFMMNDDPYSYYGTMYFYERLNVIDEVALSSQRGKLWGVGAQTAGIETEGNYSSGPYDTWGFQRLSLNGLNAGYNTLTFKHISQGGMGFGVDNILIYGPRCIAPPSEVYNAPGGSDITTYDTIYNRIGCSPTVIVTKWHVRPNNNVEQTLQVCEAVTINGRRYDATTDITDKSTNIYGCDSITTIHLIRNYPSDTNLHDTLCGGDVYKFGDISLTTGGVYTSTLKNQSQCDSVITLQLDYFPTYNFPVITDSILYDSLPYFFPVTGENYYYEMRNEQFHYVAQGGCDSNYYLTLVITYKMFDCEKGLSFPNMVTPNGDNVNDRFHIVGIEEGCYPSNELIIYNRWGAEVYHVRNIKSQSDEWDPSNMPAGTYYYRFQGRNALDAIERFGVIEVIKD